VRFIVYGALCGPAISALFGVTSLCLASFVPWSQYLHALVTWWTGDGVGVLILTPILLAWMTNKRTLRIGLEGFAFTLLLLGMSAYCLELFPLADSFHLPLFTLAPLLMWSVFRTM
jgi:integral membrane sensor domain MASE1